MWNGIWWWCVANIFSFLFTLFVICAQFYLSRHDMMFVVGPNTISCALYKCTVHTQYKAFNVSNNWMTAFRNGIGTFKHTHSMHAFSVFVVLLLFRIPSRIGIGPKIKFTKTNFLQIFCRYKHELGGFAVCQPSDGRFFSNFLLKITTLGIFCPLITNLTKFPKKSFPKNPRKPGKF